MRGTSNKRWNEIFALFFLRKWREYETKKALAEKGIGDDDYISDLISELKKPFFLDKGNVYNRRRSIFKKTSVNFLSDDNNYPEIRRNPNVCYSILLKIQGLMEFCMINGIKNDSIYNIVPFISLQVFPKNSHIFKSGDPSKRFYCILSGKVSIRFPKEENKKNANKDKTNNLSSQTTSNLKAKDSENSLAELRKKYKDIENFPVTEVRSYKNQFQIKKLSVFEYWNKSENTENHTKHGNSSLNHLRKNSPKNNCLKLDSNDFPNKLNISKNNVCTNQIAESSDTQREDEEKEVEKFVLDKGKCFGDWGLIYNHSRTATAVATEETYCFSIVKEIFDEHFGKYILKAEADRRNFFREKLHIFKDAAKFDEYYKRITVMMANSNQILYLEGDPGKTVYLVHQGELILEKNIYNKSKYNSDGYSLSRKSNTVMKLVRGAFAGMEVFCIPNSPYKYTLKTLSAFNVIFKITLDDIPECRDTIKDFMGVMYEKQNKILENLISKKTKIKKAYDLLFKTEDQIKKPNAMTEILNIFGEDLNSNSNATKQFENISLHFPTYDNSAEANYKNYDTFESSNSLKNLNTINSNKNLNHLNRSNDKSHLMSEKLLIEENEVLMSPKNNRFNSTSINTSKHKNVKDVKTNNSKNDFFMTNTNSMIRNDSVVKNKKVSVFDSCEKIKESNNNVINSGEINKSIRFFSSEPNSTIRLQKKGKNNNSNFKDNLNDSYATAEGTMSYIPSQKNFFSDFSSYMNNINQSSNQPNKKILSNKLVYCSSLFNTFKTKMSNINLKIKGESSHSKYFEDICSLENKTNNKSNVNNRYKSLNFFPTTKAFTLQSDYDYKNNKTKIKKRNYENNLINKSNINKIIEEQNKRESFVLKTPLKKCVSDWKETNKIKNKEDNNKKLFYRTNMFNLPLISYFEPEGK